MASEPPPPEPDAVIPPAPVLLPKSTPPPVESEVPIDDDRATLAGILPGSQGRVLKGEAKEVLFGKSQEGSALGRFVASRMLEKPSFRESTLLYHRAKVGMVELASLSVAILANEIGKDEPSKVKIDACLAIQRGAGIMTDSVPVNDADRQKTIAEDREVASMSPQQLLERVTGRLQAMRSASATGEGKA